MFYTQQHAFYCGVDLHAKTMHVCIVNQAGETAASDSVAARFIGLSAPAVVGPAFTPGGWVALTRQQPRSRGFSLFGLSLDIIIGRKSLQSFIHIAARMMFLLIANVLFNGF